MADVKITALPAAAGANLTDLLVKVNDPSGVPVTQKLTITQLQTGLTGKQNTIAYSTSHHGFFNFTAVDHVYTNATGKPVLIEYHVNMLPDSTQSTLKFFAFRGSDGGTEFPIGVATVAGTFTEYDWHGMWVVPAGDTLTFQVGFAAVGTDAISVEYFETKLF